MTLPTRRTRICVAALLACAVSVLAQAPATPAAGVETNACARAKALLDAGYVEAAEAEYAKALGSQPSCPPQDRPSPQARLDRARRLQDAGYDKQAQAIVLSVVSSTNQPVRVDPALRSPDQRLGWWNDTLGLLGPPVRSIIEAAIVLAILWMLYLFISRRVRRRMRVEEFVGGGTDNPGGGLTAELAATLRRLQEASRGRAVTYQSATDEQFDIPDDVAAAVPQGKLVAALIKFTDKLFPQRLMIVGGALHPIHVHRGAGLTISLKNGRGEVKDEMTVWERDFVLLDAGKGTPTSVRYERLVMPAAVWLGYQRLGARTGASAEWPFGVRDWRSYALFAVGELIPDAVDRRRVLELALDRDPRNLGARLNLASLLLRRDTQVGRHHGKEDLQYYPREDADQRRSQARQHLRYIVARSGPGDPIWYRAQFLLVLCFLDGGPPDVASAKKAYGELADAVNERVGPDGVSADDELASVLNSLGHPGDEVDGERPRNPLGAVGLQLCLAGGDAAVSPTDIGSWRTAMTEYHVARYWAKRYAGPDPHRERYLSHLIPALRHAVERHVIEVDGDLVEDALHDPWFAAVREAQIPQVRALLTRPTARAAEPEPPVRYDITLRTSDAAPV